MARIEDVRIVGNVSTPNGWVTKEDIESNAGIEATKMDHRYKCGTNFDLAIGGTPATREEIVFVADTSGTIQKFDCVLEDSGTSTDIDFDLKVNGSTVLSAAVNYVHGDGDGTVKSGTISSASLSADDIVSISMTVTSATGALGPYAWVTLDEGTAT